MRYFALGVVMVGVAWACGSSVGAGADAAASAGGSSSSTGGSGGVGGTSAINLPFDPTLGCRDFSSPDCNQCCSPGVDDTGAANCNVRQLNTSSALAGPCPSDCPACAICDTATEQSLLADVSQPRPDCDCRSVYVGIDPCFSPNDCGCFCDGLERSLAECPQLGKAVCQSANHCGVQLAIEPGPYHPGDIINLYWINFSAGTAYVDNCGNPEVLQLHASEDAFFIVASAQPCASPDAAMTLAPGQQSSPISVSVPTGVGGGLFRLYGTYHINCGTDSVIATTCNPGTIDVSINFDVYSQ